ncbi:NUDIX hydrolase domain-like protein [Hygrophoropsis aurantiaca]|uniref:NUDIX hydrolase domain-like protein n=1 Tax=Hygrophoropsis aurantiaca TaxID=72124 RepID=A0ACB8AS67_9AGAM|nr:NUDIX hydrolase domain-like protein [Hygrophoropsis aurantiaca]
MNTSKPEFSFLDLIDKCDNFRLPANYGSDAPNPTLVPWTLSSSSSSPVIGLLWVEIVDLLATENEASIRAEKPEVWVIHRQDSDTGSRPNRVSFHDTINTPTKRTAIMKELCERWRDTGLFPDIIGPKKWRDEKYPVYRNPLGVHRPCDLFAGNELEDGSNYAFDLERSACALFGVVTYGVHMTIYEDNEDGVRIWVPTRALTKQTWPGYLDNSVAGGIPSGMAPFESIIKEAMEEASIEQHIVENYAKSIGSISYFYRNKSGWLQPEVEYLYDLKIPPGVDQTPFQPKPLDGEVESFDLLPLDTVITKMRGGLFKANCALALVDFLIRHGYITPDNEPDFMQIITRLHGSFQYDQW